MKSANPHGADRALYRLHGLAVAETETRSNGPHVGTRRWTSTGIGPPRTPAACWRRWCPEAYSASTTGRAIEGTTNDRVCQFLAEDVGVRPSEVSIMAGAHGCDKVALVRAVSAEALRRALTESLRRPTIDADLPCRVKFRALPGVRSCGLYISLEFTNSGDWG